MSNVDVVRRAYEACSNRDVETVLTLWAGAWNVQTYRPAFAIRLAHVWTLRDGKILWFYNYVDTAALLAAIGVGSNSVRGDD